MKRPRLVIAGALLALAALLAWWWWPSSRSPASTDAGPPEPLVDVSAWHQPGAGAPVGSARPTAPTGSTPTPDRATFTGTVTDAYGVPVAGAHVEALPPTLEQWRLTPDTRSPETFADALEAVPLVPPLVVTTSDAAGRYTVQAPPAAVVLAHAGEAYGFRMLGPYAVDIALWQRGAPVVQLVDTRGRPVPDVAVTLIDGAARWRERLRTDLDGAVRAPRPSERLCVVARPPGAVPTAACFVVLGSSRNVVRVSEAASLDVTVTHEGRPTSAELRLSGLAGGFADHGLERSVHAPGGAVTVTGLRHERYTVTATAPGLVAVTHVNLPAQPAVRLELSPVATLALSVRSDGGSGEARAELTFHGTHSHGAPVIGGPPWEVSLPAGEVEVRVDAPDTVHVQQRTRVTPGRNELTVTLEPLRQLSGRVLEPDGTPAADAEVRLSCGGSRSSPTSTKPDGTFVLSQRGAPPCTVTARSTLGSGTLELPTAPPGPVELVLEHASLDVLVKTAAGAPLPNARAASRGVSCVSDAAGRCTLANVACPRDTVWVSAQGAIKARANCVDGGARAQAVLPPAAEVSGRVLDARGRPVALAEVTATTSASDDDEPDAVLSGADGAFAFAELAVGARVELHATQGKCAAAPVKVTAPAANVTLTAPTPRRVRGRAVGLDGGAPTLVVACGEAFVVRDGQFDCTTCEARVVVDGFGAGQRAVELGDEVDAQLGALVLGPATTPTPGPAELLALARQSRRAGQAGLDVVPLLDLCLSLDPTAFDCHKLRGSAYATAGDGEAAAAAYEEFLRYAPPDHPGRAKAAAVVRDYRAR